MIRDILSRYDRQVWVLTGGSLIGGFGFSIAYPFVALYLFMYRGIPMTDVGIALLVAALVGLISQFAAGELCDRIGRKTVMNLGLGTNAIAFVLLAVAVLTEQGYAVFVLLLCLRELTGGLYRNVPSIMIADVVEPGDRNGAFSLIRIGANLGFALGPFLGGLLALYSYAAMFAVAAVTCMLYFLISLFLLRDTRPEHCGQPQPGGNGAIRGDRPFLLYCVVAGLVGIVFSQIISTFSSYAGSYGHINESLIGILFSLNGFMIVLLQYPVAVFLGRFRLTTALMIGTLLYAVGYGSLGFCRSFWPLFACMFVISLGEIVSAPSSLNIVARMARPENRGRYMSFSGVITNAGFAIGPFIGGFLMDAFASRIEMMWLSLGALAIVCVFGFLLLRFTVNKEIDKT
ncbi:MAG: MFS transporter [Methanocella sp.]